MRNTIVFSDYPDVMSVSQTADALHIAKTTAYELVNSNRIKSFRIGRTIKVPKVSLIDFIDGAVKGGDSDGEN